MFTGPSRITSRVSIVLNEWMIAARMHRIGAELRVERVKVPTINDGEVLVNVRASGICHSDINYRDGIAPVGKLPITLGHEIAGVVVRTGARVKGIREGERALLHYIKSCGRCSFCRSGFENYCNRYQMIGKDVDGGFAEFAKIPARNIVKIPEALPYEQAAIMGCAVPTAYHALKRGRVHPGNVVVILGVGGLGIHAVQLATRIFKAGTVVAVDVLDWKLRLAKRLGAKVTVNANNDDVSEIISRVTDGKFGDVVLDFVGHRKTIEQAIASTGKGGRVVIVGISRDSLEITPYKTIIGRELEIIGVDDHLNSELDELVKLVRAEKISLSRSITHKVTLNTINHGFKILESTRERALRIVVVKDAES